MTASFRDLEEAVGGLPWVLREQVLGYARSIEAALPDIFLNAGRRFDQAIANDVVFLSGIRKLYGIVAGSYWTLDNSASLLEEVNVTKITAGSSDFSRYGVLHRQLRLTLAALEKVIDKHELRDYVSVDYEALIGILIDERRRS